MIARQRSLRRGLVAGLGALLFVGCASRAPRLTHAKRLLEEGQLRQACAELRQLVEQPAARARRLSALRGWVDCLARAGELDQARRHLARQPDDGARWYGQALVDVADSPAGLGSALQLLRRAAERWPDQAEIPYRAAVLLLADEQPGAALPLLERACRLADSAACAVARAHAWLDLDRLSEALAEVGRAVRLQPRRADIARGRALIQRIGRRTANIPAAARERHQQLLELVQRQERAAEAIRLAEELLMDHPRLGPVQTLLGLAQLRLGNAAEAVVALRRAAQLAPYDAANPLYLGVIHQGRGRLEESVEHYRAALRLDPFLGRAAQQLGEILLRLRRPSEAALALDHAVAVDGGAPLSLRLAGRAHFAAGALERAERCFQRLLQREPPGDFEVHLRLGQLLLRRGRQGELRRQAEEHARRAAALHPNDPELARLREQLAR
jgi:tetratricopeptide (TPR) repeat protein